MKLKGLFLYLLILLIETPIVWLYINSVSPEKYPLNSYWLVLSFLALGIISLPFFILTEKGNHKFQVIGKSVLIWILLLPAPLLLSLSNLANVKFLIYLVEILIGSLIIWFYKIPYSFMVLALILPGLANLYLLLYGSLKQNRF